MIGPPTVNDDSTTGLGNGSPWLDEVGENGMPVSYILLDDTPGAAVWRRLTVCGQDGKVSLDHIPTSIAALVNGGSGDGGNIDGGTASSVYAPGQVIDGGSA